MQGRCSPETHTRSQRAMSFLFQGVLVLGSHRMLQVLGAGAVEIWGSGVWYIW